MELKGKVLALDYGTKRVGVATGDFEFGIAFPRTVLENENLHELITNIIQLCDELDVQLIVVGLPLNMDLEHQKNRIMTEVRYFVKELREKIPSDVNVTFFDERLSTFEADSLMKETMEKVSSKPLGRDAYAAQVILQRFFDKNK